MTVQSSLAGFERADDHRRRLRKIIANATAVADGLKAASAPNMRKIDERVATDVFRVMVVGEFKRGKSTLINAMLGDNVLPAYARPATAVLTELRWSAEPTADLYPADDRVPVKVKVADLTKYITIPKGARQDANTSPWKLAKVGWPLDILRSGVILIDSPGLNEHPARQAVTLENLNLADAIVFVQDSQHPVSVEEVHFMDLYLDTYDVFFVFNKINIIADNEVAEVKEDALFRLQEHRDDQHHDRYYFVNALAGLNARISGDDTVWHSSAMADFVHELNAFLVTERHRAKLIGPAREVSREIQLLRQTVPEQRALIEQTQTELQRRYEEAQAPLRQLETRAEQMRQELNLAQRNMVRVVRSEVARRLDQLCLEMPDIIRKATTDAGVSLNPLKAKGAAEAYAKELAERAMADAASRFKAWQKEDLKAILEPGVVAMAGRADDLFQEFMRDLAKVRKVLTGPDLSAGSKLSGLGGEGSLVDVEIAGMGALSFSHLMGQLVAVYGVLLAWAFTPFGWASLIFGVLTANTALWATTRRLMDMKVRKALSTAMVKKMREDVDANADKCAQAFRKTMSSEVGKLMSRVDSELKQLRVQVEDALGTLNEGEDMVTKHREKLAAWEKLLETSLGAIEDLISEVALT